MVPIWLALVLPSILVRPAVSVRGNTGCPTAEEVAARATALLPAVSGPREPDVVELEDQGPVLRVTLRRADGALIGRRSLQRSFSCADLAAAVGVVIATWQSDVHPEFKLDMGGATGAPSPRPTSPPSPAPRSSQSQATRERRAAPQSPPSPSPSRARPIAAPVAVASTSPGPPPASPPKVAAEQPRRIAAVTPPATLTATAPPPPVPRDDRRGRPSGGVAIDVGAGILGALAPIGDAANGGAAAGGLLRASWMPSQSANAGWGVHLGLWGMSDRSAALQSGTARWRRVAVRLGPQRRWSSQSRGWVVDAHAEALGAWLAIHGTGFAPSTSDGSLDAGLGVGTRVTFGHGRVRPWVDVSLTGWVLPHIVYEEPANSSATLPRFEGMLAIGVSLWGAR